MSRHIAPLFFSGTQMLAFAKEFSPPLTGNWPMTLRRFTDLQRSSSISRLYQTQTIASFCCYALRNASPLPGTWLLYHHFGCKCPARFVHERLLEEENDDQSGQEHGNGGGHQQAAIDDVKLAVECSESEHGHRHVRHPRGQSEDGADEGDAAPGLIKQQRQ